MITAYSATPLARHIDTPEQAQPVYTDLDALLADMHADAKQIRKRGERERPSTPHAKGRLAEHLVYDFIKANPGQGKAAIADGCGLTVKQIEGALTNMSRYPSRFPIRREYANGMRSAVRVWATEAAQ